MGSWVRIPPFPPLHRPGSQTGKGVGFKSRSMCGFESHLGHQNNRQTVGSNPTRPTKRFHAERFEGW